MKCLKKSLDFEKDFYSSKVKYIAGCDEAGRGPLAGPVVAGAVIFPQGYQNPFINDSKQLSKKQREEIALIIKRDALAYATSEIEAEEIDKINIYQASKLAMINALNSINHPIDLVITDAMSFMYKNIEVVDVIKGDTKALCVAAASILAKVRHDEILEELDKKYPQYDFKNNEGYGTKTHLEALKTYGPIKGVHRYTYRPVRESLEIKLF